jgi:uncharacterized protein (DUF2267 family)
MSQHGLAAFESTLQTSYAWLNDLMEELGWTDRHRAYQALRSVLHAVRDRLTIDEAADLGAQLPMLLRGMYYEGWNPADTPIPGRSREDFLAPIAETFHEHPEITPEGVVWAVFKVMEQHISWGEMQEVKHMLPDKIRALCP